jgi:hypothetical protein
MSSTTLKDVEILTLPAWRRFLKRRTPEFSTTRSFQCIFCAKCPKPLGPDQLRVFLEDFDPKESCDLKRRAEVKET